MITSKPNENGVLEPGYWEIVAQTGRSYALVNVALCEDGLYRYAVDMRYSHGGFSGQITIDEAGLPTVIAVIEAGLEELLRRWHSPFPSEPQNVHDELNDLRRQIEARRRQPLLF